MIRSLTLVRHTSADKFEQLSRLLRALGFEDGRAWSDEHGHGASFLAGVGSLELVEGRTSEPDILIEVSDLDGTHQIAKKHLRAASGEIGEIEDTSWKSRLFTVQFDENFRVGFWGFNDPLKFLPASIEGELNASGMRFGIVVS